MGLLEILSKFPYQQGNVIMFLPMCYNIAFSVILLPITHWNEPLSTIYVIWTGISVSYVDLRIIDRRINRLELKWFPFRTSSIYNHSSMMELVLYSSLVDLWWWYQVVSFHLSQWFIIGHHHRPVDQVWRPYLRMAMIQLECPCWRTLFYFLGYVWDEPAEL